MKLSRLAGLIFLVALAVNLMAAAVASAAAPEFRPGTLNLFKGESSTGALETSSTKPIKCTSDTSTGEITGAKTVGSVVVTFHGCESEEGTGCPVNSPGQGAGLIKTETLDGELGSVKKTEAASGVGLLLLPTVGTSFVTLEGTCLLLSPAPVTGTLAGEATPLNKSSKDGDLIFEGSKGVQKIKTINVLGTEEKPVLEALGILKASETTLELVLYDNVVEVT
jgi:hypothetical protein